MEKRFSFVTGKRQPLAEYHTPSLKIGYPSRRPRTPVPLQCHFITRGCEHKEETLALIIATAELIPSIDSIVIAIVPIVPRHTLDAVLSI